MNSHAYIRLLALAALLPICTAPHAGKLNDTGQTQCLKAGVLSSDCALTKQDAAYGRDVAFNNNADGKAGFSYVKISSTGAELPATATAWSCVKDKLTGLIWEVKTADGGLHDASRNFDHSGSDTGNSTRAFVTSVNAAGLCGHSDWRMPTRMELAGIIDYGAAAMPPIDTNWFQNAPSSNFGFWTDTPISGNTVTFWATWSTGEFSTTHSTASIGARVVRSDVVAAADVETEAVRFVPKGDKVKDKLTGLIWKRCSEGQTWDGSTCTGTPRLYQWLDAVALAAATPVDNPWRLPNAKELMSLIDERGNQPGGLCSAPRFTLPAIDPVAFPNTACNQYWTSTFTQAAVQDAWAVRFQADGVMFPQNRTNSFAVRLVRGTP